MKKKILLTFNLMIFALIFIAFLGENSSANAATGNLQYLPDFVCSFSDYISEEYGVKSSEFINYDSNYNDTVRTYNYMNVDVKYTDEVFTYKKVDIQEQRNDEDVSFTMSRDDMVELYDTIYGDMSIFLSLEIDHSNSLSSSIEESVKLDLPMTISLDEFNKLPSTYRKFYMYKGYYSDGRKYMLRLGNYNLHVYTNHYEIYSFRIKKVKTYEYITKRNWIGNKKTTKEYTGYIWILDKANAPSEIEYYHGSYLSVDKTANEEENTEFSYYSLKPTYFIRKDC